MKDDEGLHLTVNTTTNLDAAFFGRGRYKFWALAAILLLAFWSMFTGTVTLRWSAGNLNRLTDDVDTHLHDDLDVLEMEEREKVVRHMWDVYVNSRRIWLPRFWEEAFKAAYEELTSDLPGVRDAAISEIAKMSVSTSVDLDLDFDLNPPSFQSANAQELSKSLKVVEKRGSATTSKGK